jgi:hypothetical protein
MSVHRHRFLFGRSSSSNNPDELVMGHYDLFLVAPSWDHRCESITAAKHATVTSSILLRFTTKDDFGFQAGHEQSVEAFLKKYSKEVFVIEGDAVKLAEVWSSLWQAVISVVERNHCPLRVLVDLSTCPRYYSLGFIAGLLQLGLARMVTVFYAEGQYLNHTAAHPIDYPFTVGQWSATAIPFLKGSPDALKQKAYIVSAGFEGVKTSRVLAREDPDRVAVLFPDPGVRPGYVDEAWNRNKEIIDQFRIPNEQIVRAPAGDAVGAWKALTRANLERAEDESVYYLCSGTKPHSLGLGLRAICLGFPTVMYNLPERHTFVEVTPSGVFWAYHIVDLTTPARTSKAHE